MHDAGLFRGERHFARFFTRRGEWLVAVDVLPRGQRGEDLFAVLIVRRADVHDVYVRVLDDLAPVGCGELVAGLRATVFGGLLMRRGDSDESDIRRGGVVIHGNRAVALGMHLAHESVAEHSDADGWLGHEFLWVDGVSRLHREGGDSPLRTMRQNRLNLT